MTTSLGRALVGGTAAGILAAVVNALIFATGVIDQSVETPAGGPILLGAVVTFSVVPNVVATSTSAPGPTGRVNGPPQARTFVTCTAPGSD